MDEVLTIAQIEAQFQSEWVLIEEPKTNEALEVQSGKVRWHSKDREEVYRKVVEMHPRRFAVLYTGTMPEDTAIVLKIVAVGHVRSGFPVLGHTLPPSTGVDGLLGLDFFRGQNLTIDFRTGQVTLA